jgi:hypothetical protein
MTLAIVSILVGAVFGLRFQLYVLVPIIGLSVVLIIAAGITNGDGAWSIASFSALIASTFQIGYLGGSFTRFAITSPHRGRRLARGFGLSARSTPKKPS